MSQVHFALREVAGFRERVRGGEWKAYSRSRIRNVIKMALAAVSPILYCLSNHQLRAAINGGRESSLIEQPILKR
jgi:hypothetical protein